MKKLLSAIATAMVGVALSVGYASASTGSISTTGQGSTNKIIFSSAHKTKVVNDNDVKVSNSNFQKAESGSATVYNNTKVGHVSTGDAKNTNSTSTEVAINNSHSSVAALKDGGSGGSDSASINLTGQGSTNKIVFDNPTTVKVVNDNDVKVTNTSKQIATSGDCTVKNNTTVGSCTTGDASNTNSTSTSVHITN